MHNITAVAQSYPSAPPTASPEDELLSSILLLFALMCTNNAICTGVFEILLALLTEVFSYFLHATPGQQMRRNYCRTEDATNVDRFMLLAWIVANIGGAYAFKAQYDHNINSYYPNHDSADNFDAVADALFAHSVVTTMYTGLAGLGTYYIYPSVNRGLRSLRDCCTRREHTSTDYHFLPASDASTSNPANLPIRPASP